MRKVEFLDNSIIKLEIQAPPRPGKTAVWQTGADFILFNLGLLKCQNLAN
jgi:hypothetical protein